MNLNKIIEFRQAIYEQFFGKRRDPLFEAWDALLLQGKLTSFPELSLNTVFQRKWHSLYKGLEKGEIDSDGLTNHLSQMVPQEGVCYYALDGTGWPAIPKSPMTAKRRSPWQSLGAAVMGASTL